QTRHSLCFFARGILRNLDGDVAAANEMIEAVPVKSGECADLISRHQKCPACIRRRFVEGCVGEIAAVTSYPPVIHRQKGRPVPIRLRQRYAYELGYRKQTKREVQRIAVRPPWFPCSWPEERAAENKET